MRGAGRHADGSRVSMVERARSPRSDALVAVADAAGHSPALEWLPASSDAGQGGTHARLAAASVGTARDAGDESASVAGRLSLGTQPGPAAPGPGNGDSGQPLATEPQALRSTSCALGISGGSARAESGRRRQDHSGQTALENRQ